MLRKRGKEKDEKLGSLGAQEVLIIRPTMPFDEGICWIFPKPLLT